MISQKARYAFKALLCLARMPMGESLQIKEIAAREAIPRSFLEHILLDLKRMRVVGSRRGQVGGYFLLKPAEQIAFGDILWQIDGPMAPLSCLSRQAYRRCADCENEASCPLRAGFFSVFQAQLSALGKMTLAGALDLAEGQGAGAAGYGADPFSGANI